MMSRVQAIRSPEKPKSASSAGFSPTIAALGGYALCAARLRGSGREARRAMTREPTEQRTVDILMTALRGALSDARFDALDAEGPLLSEDRAVAEALAL